MKHALLATIAAERSTFKQRLGAVIFRNARILSTGFNQTNTHTSLVKTTSWPGSCHAEVSAIANAFKNYKVVKGADMLVVRLKRSGELGLAMPCESCMRVLYNAQIRRVYYSNDEGGFGCIYL